MKALVCLAAGVLLGGAAVFGLFALALRPDVSAPTLRPATAITVTLFPSALIGGADCVPVLIPPDKLDVAFRLLTPMQYRAGGQSDFESPIVAEAVVRHADGTETSVLVRDHGHNPAGVSLDGRNYFYARNDPDVRAGGTELVRLVLQAAHTKRSERRPKP